MALTLGSSHNFYEGFCKDMVVGFEGFREALGWSVSDGFGLQAHRFIIFGTQSEENSEKVVSIYQPLPHSLSDHFIQKSYKSVQIFFNSKILNGFFLSEILLLKNFRSEKKTQVTCCVK